MSPRVALTGDAAHAMSPHITAGASLGVEDVGARRDKLSSDADLTTALKEYEADRLPRYRQSAVLSRADRCDVVACDFFTDRLPSGAGCYLLAHVIHNWNEEQALAILRAVRAAIPDNGRLLLVEAIIPDDDSAHLAKDLDIRLLTILRGGGRTEPEYARLLAGAGFRPQPAISLARIESVITATPAS